MIYRLLYRWYRWRIPARVRERLPEEMRESEMLEALMAPIEIEMAHLWAALTTRAWRQKLTGWMS